MTILSKDDVLVFASSLPESYRNNFDAPAIAEHARLSRERESAPANVGEFTSVRVPGSAICVVADDRPGLLAIISAALVLCGLDVIEAEAYTRQIDDRHPEAVDVFWVRHDDPAKRSLPVAREQIELLRRTLSELIEGKLDRRRANEPSGRVSATPAASETIVRFIEGKDGMFATLEVETGDRSGLLLSLSQALFNQRVQIVGSQVKTVGARVYDRFHIVELDGSSINPTRRLEIQVAVLSALDPILESKPTPISVVESS